MLRHLWVTFVLVCAGCLTAATGRQANQRFLFHESNVEDSARTTIRADEVEKELTAGKAAPHSDDAVNRFGWGLAIGGDAGVLGWGSTFSFEYFPLPWLAVGSRLSFSIGFLDEPYMDADGGPSGIGFLLTHQVGARLVLDFESMGPMRWFRPFIAFYPLGFAYLNAGTEIEEPNGRFNSVNIEDVFYIVSGGFGLDLFVSRAFGLGFAVFAYNTIGGSTHREHGGQYRTDGGEGVIVDVLRFSVRF